MSIPGGTRPMPDEELSHILEAVRRANWDALHGPLHLRTGRYWSVPAVSSIDGPSAPAGPDRRAATRTADSSDGSASCNGPRLSSD
jgi:hypothetical protein